MLQLPPGTKVLVGDIFALSLYLVITAYTNPVFPVNPELIHLSSWACSSLVLPHSLALLDPKSMHALVWGFPHGPIKDNRYIQFSQGMPLEHQVLVAMGACVSGLHGT